MRKAMYLMGVLDDMDIEWLATHGSGLLAPRGKTLVREGQALDSVFVLLDGELSVTTGSKQIATLYAGEVVGEISFVDSRPPLATVTASVDSRLHSATSESEPRSTCSHRAARLVPAVPPAREQTRTTTIRSRTCRATRTAGDRLNR